jgi:hypothetical protein
MARHHSSVSISSTRASSESGDLWIAKQLPWLPWQPCFGREWGKRPFFRNQCSQHGKQKHWLEPQNGPIPHVIHVLSLLTKRAALEASHGTS